MTSSTNLDPIEEILEVLDDNLSNEPGATTEIGWERWSEEKQDYYLQAKAAIQALIDTKVREARLDEWDYINYMFGEFSTISEDRIATLKQEEEKV